jgi:gamma-glutamylcyclotransferase (GGCT)/AIG2-like uncharacterized protein YtfP
VRIFIYGTLLNPRTLAERSGHPALASRLQPAKLGGWRRVPAKDGRYPTLVRDRAGRVDGAVLVVSAAAFRRLQAYEGPRYQLMRVLAETQGGPVPAHAWIAGTANRRIGRS